MGPGLGLGGGKAPPLFAGKKIKEAKSLSKINGLVNEFTRSVGQVRMRWPLGLGKYLLDKLEESMMTRGVLEVDKIAGKRGNYVFTTVAPSVSPTSLTTSPSSPLACPLTSPLSLSSLPSSLSLPRARSPLARSS